MKKILLPAFISCIAFCSAQSWNLTGNAGTSVTNYLGTSDNKPFIIKSNNIEGLRILPDGSLRMGADNDPVTSAANLRIYKSDAVSVELANSMGRFQIAKGNCNNCFANGAIAGDAVLRNLGVGQNILFYIPNNLSNGSSYIGFGDDANGIWAKVLTNKTARFDGKIYAKEIEVKTNVWADYVFNKEYKLKSLEEVEKYISEKGHLPNIPSASEVIEKGINVAEMAAKLLEKVEELTLYSIEQNKQLKLQSEEIKKLKNQVQELITNHQ